MSLSLVGWIEKAARSASVFLGVLRNRNGLPQLSRGLAKSAYAIVYKAMFYVINSIGGLSKLLNNFTSPSLKNTELDIWIHRSKFR